MTIDHIAVHDVLERASGEPGRYTVAGWDTVETWDSGEVCTVEGLKIHFADIRDGKWRKVDMLTFEAQIVEVGDGSVTMSASPDAQRGAAALLYRKVRVTIEQVEP